LTQIACLKTLFTIWTLKSSLLAVYQPFGMAG
jgi:hypothetical protein